MAKSKQQRGGKPVRTVAPNQPLPARLMPGSGVESSPVWIGWLLGMHVMCLGMVVLGMTALTYNVDDIKVPLFMFGGPLLILFAFVALAWGGAALPVRGVLWGVTGYFIVMVLSTILGKYRWIGWDQVFFVWSAMGFFLSAHCIASDRRGSEWFLRYIVLQLFVVNVIGFFMFDMFPGAETHSILHWFFTHLYSPAKNHSGGLYQILLTLATKGEPAMQSTILNRDFYAGFCLLYLPFAMLMGIDAGRSRVPLLWHLIGMVASLMTIVSVFYCKSKGEYIFGVIGVVLFIGLFLKAGQLSRLRRRHVLAWIGGVVMLLGAVAWMQSPEMADQLKSVGVSVKSRSIIWEGSWKLFLSHPIFGGGPGSFRIYFPQFRNADYFLYEISNVTLYSHNYFLDLLSETGVLGFGCYMTMLGTLCVGGLWWAVKHQDPRLRGILVACFVSMVGIFGSNLSSPNARWVIGASSLWTVMGFFSGILHQANVPSAQVEASASLTSRRKQAASADFGWRPYVFGSLTFLSLIVAPVIGRHGVLYFQSALPYAKGYSSMTVAYDAVDKGSNNLSGIEDYLKDSAVQYEKSLKVVPSNVSASYKLGSVYTQLMRINQNRAAEYKQEKDAKTARHFQNVADHYLNKARETYEKVVCYWPEYAEIPYNFGIIYKFYADYLRRSAQDLEDQPEKPDLPAAKKGEHVASLLSQADVMEKNALKCLERMEEMSIKPEVALQLGRAYEEMGMLVRANEVYRAASHDNPDNKDLISRYYRSAYKLDQVSGMADAMELYCQLDMNQYQLINNLINLCLENDLNDPLDRLLSRIRARDPIDARLYEVGIMRAGKLADDEALLSALDQYLKVGGTSTSYIQMGVESARKIGLADKALYYEGLLRNAGVDTVTTPTVIQ